MISKISSFLAKIFGRRNKPADSALQQAEESLIKAASLKSPAPRPGFQAELMAKLREQRQPATMSSKIQTVIAFIKIRPAQFSAAIAVVVLVAVVATSLQLLVPQESKWARLIIDQAYAQDNFEVSPTKADSLGIAKDSSFIVKSKTAITANDLEKSLIFVPKLQFKVKTINDREFSVVPTEALKDRTVYKVIINSGFTNNTGAEMERDYSWAFQVKDVFKVLGTLPANNTSYIPLETGIEITFSKAGFMDVEKYFAIEPKVEGRFETHNRTLVFVPKQNLNPGTIYTITLKKGVPVAGTTETLAEDTVFRFETNNPAKYNDQNNANYFDFANSRRFENEFTPDVAPALAIYKTSNVDQQITVDVFDIGSAENYAKLMGAQTGWSVFARQIKTEGLKKVSTFKAETTSNDYYGFMLFPKALPAGYYVISAVAKGSTEPRQALIQVSNLMGYVSENTNESLLWVNHRVTKGTVPHATLTVQGKKLGETNDQGVLTFNTKQYLLDDKNAYNYVPAIVTAGKESIVINLLLNSAEQLKQKTNYWSHVYTDRPMYHSNDTINVWGFVKSDDGSIPTEVTIKVNSGSYDYYNEPIALIKANVQVKPNGTYHTQLQLKDALPRWYYINVEKGDQVINSTYFTVSEFVKPSYVLEMTQEKSAVFSGEAVNYTVTAKFFDGTPAANLDMFYSNNYSNETAIKTDSFGVARFMYRHNNQSETNPSYDYLHVRVGQGEGAQVDVYANTTVFNSHIYSSNEFTINNKDSGKIVTYISTVNPDARVKESSYENYNDLWFREKPAANVSFTAVVTETWYEQVETGEAYDFINKKKFKTYRHEQRNAKAVTYNGVTDDKGLFTYEFTVNKERQYSVRVVAVDNFGLKDYSTAYANRANNYYYDGGSNDYEYYSLRLRTDGSSFKVGESHVIDFNSNKGLVSSTGQFLYTKHNNGLVSHEVSKESHVEKTFNADDIPTVSFNAVWFDGKVYHQAEYGLHLYYNHEDQVIKIEVATDKKEYKPGEKVTAQVKVTDKNGNPVSAAYNLNVVDEAFYALSNDSVDTASSLYNSMRKGSGVLYTYVSHRALLFLPPGGGAEGGGGGDGGDSFRKDFKDTGLFFSGETDKNGNGATTFTLPDNITAWRITSQTITTDLQAGSSISNITATLPFFAEVTTPTELLASDKPVIKVRAYGTSLKNGQAVTTTVKATDFGLDSAQNGKAFESLYFTVPSLKLGEHTVTSSVTVGTAKDGVVQKIKVIESRIQEYKNETVLLSPTSSIKKDIKGGSNITFTDAGRGKLMYDFYDLAFAPGERVEQKLARQIGQKYLNEYFEREFTPEIWNSSEYQKNGGVQVLKYGSEDLETSARLASFANDYFDRASYAGYFYRIINLKNVSKDQLVYSFYGLAQLGEPVLLEVQSLAKDASLTPMQKLYVASALEALGDREAARAVYAPLVKQYAESLGSVVRLAINKNEDDMLLATALAADLSVASNDTLHEKMFAYVKTHRGKDILTLAEEAKYLEIAFGNAPKEKGSFSLVINGAEHNIALAPGQVITYEVTKDQRDHTSFKNIVGRIAMVHTYQETVELNTNKATNGLSVSREYKVNNKTTTEFNESDIVVVFLSPQVTEKLRNNTFEITDYLPSGLKPLDIYSNVSRYDYNNSACHSYPSEINGQVVKFNFSAYCTTAYYTARVVAKGTYTAEPAVIQSVNSPELKNFSSSGSIIIK